MLPKIIFQGKIFSVIQKVIHINGHDYTRDIIEHPGGAAILVIKDHKVLLVKQSRAGANCQTLEIPAGTIDHKEDPINTAFRELNEECGLETDELKLIASFWPTPGYCTEKLFVYLATNVQKAKEKLDMDESEDIQVYWMDLDEAWKMINSGEILDGKTLIALQWAQLHLKEVE